MLPAGGPTERPGALLPPGLSPDGVLIEVVLSSGERSSFMLMGHFDLLSELAGDP